jgi:hypothetical protein
VIDLQNVRINTAGAYVSVHGRYPFAIGATLYQGRIPVFRLGGHREEGETGWRCAQREVYEETGLRLKPLKPRTTYSLVEGIQAETDLQETLWNGSADQGIIPLLVISYPIQGERLLSLMYLAEAEEFPTPSPEVPGLLLLDEEKIHWLCQAPRTLAQYLDGGGKALLAGQFDHSLILEPFIQLRLFSNILRR